MADPFATTENIIKSYQHKIDKELNKFFVSFKKKYSHLDYVPMIIKSMEDFSMRGGKKLRPILMIQGYNLFKPVNQEIIKASISIEMTHNFLLIHDDITDRDTLRRGSLTLNKFYSNYFKSCSHSELSTHLGNSTAMTIGNIFFSLSNAIISRSSFPEKNKLQALKILNEIITDVGIGQILDVLYSLELDIAEEKILRMYYLKSAVYSFTCPLVLGATLAGARKSSIKKIESFSRSLGLAFQIKDDLLDLYGTESTMGKSVGSDFREAKKTFLNTNMLKRASPKDRQVILNSLGNKKLKKRDIEELKRIGLKTKTYDYCDAMIVRLIQEAKDILRKCSYRKEGIEILLQIADYIQKREL